MTNKKSNENYEELNVGKYSPWRDGSAREILEKPTKWPNLKALAPRQMKEMYRLFKQGCKDLPRDLLMSVPTADGQVALLMAWYKLHEIERPCVRTQNRITPDQVRKIRELRGMHLSYKEIRNTTGVPLTTVYRYTDDVLEGGNTKYDKYNVVSKEKYGKYFCHLKPELQRIIVKLVDGT